MAAAIAPPLTFQRAVNGLIERARTLLGHLRSATHASLPARFTANPARAEQRIDRTLHWVIALARTLVGDTTYLKPWRLPRLKPLRRLAPLTAATRAELNLPIPHTTEAQREAARLRYMKTIFATEPTGKIARRLARRLGLTEASDAWPRALLEITETPAERAKRARAAIRPATLPDPVPPAHDTPVSGPQPPRVGRDPPS